MTAILLLSGVNLGLLGSREPEVYGTDTLADHVRLASETAAAAGADLRHVQSDDEGGLVRAIHEARDWASAIVINPGAFTHYAWALHDALAAFEGAVIELHLSHPPRREAWRGQSVVAPVADASITGLGGDGYRVAIESAIRLSAR